MRDDKMSACSLRNSLDVQCLLGRSAACTMLQVLNKEVDQVLL